MPSACTLSFTSDLATPMATVWEIVGTMQGVNSELSPWLSMTAPPQARVLRIEDAPIGKPLFASWVLLGGVLPIDRHSFTIVEVNRGSGFVEQSTSWSERTWEHRRHVEPLGERACRLTDQLTFTPRIALSRPLLERVVTGVFRHRHRVLRARFGDHAATRR